MRNRDGGSGRAAFNKINCRIKIICSRDAVRHTARAPYRVLLGNRPCAVPFRQVQIRRYGLSVIAERHSKPSLSHVLQVLLSIASLVSVSSGCSLFGQQRNRQANQFTGEMPSARDVVAAINRNAARLQSLRADDVDISVHQKGHITLPLDGKLALEKPRRFRLIATNAFGGREADLGSNDEEFWFYVRHGAERPALVHCSYAEYGRAARSLPFQPEWILDSVGLTPLSETENHVVQPGKRGTVELITPTVTPDGRAASIITVVQLNTGWILERHLDVGGRRVASAILSKHRADPVLVPQCSVVYPASIDISWPDQGLEVTLRLGKVVVNPRLNEQFWRMPRLTPEEIQAGADDVDLGATARSNQPRRARPPQARIRPDIYSGAPDTIERLP